MSMQVIALSVLDIADVDSAARNTFTIAYLAVAIEVHYHPQCLAMDATPACCAYR